MEETTQTTYRIQEDRRIATRKADRTDRDQDQIAQITLRTATAPIAGGLATLPGIITRDNFNKT